MFPLVLERRLSQHSVEFIHASPAGGPPVWGDCVSTVSAPRLLEGPPDVDAVVLGGGHLVHASPASFPHYDRGGLSPLLAYPALWLGAAHWAAKGERPFAWNAVGVPRSLTPSTSALVRWTLSVSDYVSVRDRQSARLLTAAGVEREVPVVVDTALEVSDLWTAEEIDEAFAAAFEARGRSVPERTVCFHLNRRYMTDSVAVLAARLDRMCAFAGATGILVAMGPCHGDDVLQREVAHHMRTDPVVVDRPRSLREVAACVARSQAYLGSSLHGMVTACSFGTPGAVIASEATAGFRKFTGFLEQFGLTEWLMESWPQAEKKLDALLAAPGGHWSRVLEEARPTLDRHWSDLWAALESGSDGVTGGRTSSKGAALGVLRDHASSAEIPLLHGLAGDGFEALRERARADERRLRAALAGRDERIERRRASNEKQERTRTEVARAGSDQSEAARAPVEAPRQRTDVERVEEVLTTEHDERIAQLESEGRRYSELLGTVRAEREHLERLVHAQGLAREALQDQLDASKAEGVHLLSERDDVRSEATARLHDVESLRARAQLASVRHRRLEIEVQLRDLRIEEAARDLHRLARSLERARASAFRDRSRHDEELLDTQAKALRDASAAEHAHKMLRNRAAALERATAAKQSQLAFERATAAKQSQLALERATAAKQSQLALEASEQRRREAERAAAALFGELEHAREETRRVSRSRAWRIGHRLMRFLRAVALRRSMRPEGAVELLLERLEGLEPPRFSAPKAETKSLPPDGAVSRPAASSRLPQTAKSAPRSRERLKVTVISWDMGHNPVGRAYLIADVLSRTFEVEIVGAHFDRYGSDVWAPVRDGAIAMRTFEGASFPQHVERMERFARTIDGDVLYVSKPRLPSLQLGLLAKEHRNRPLLLDVDDRELSFFGGRPALDLSGVEEMRDHPEIGLPFGEVWTRYCDGLATTADHITVSNLALRELFGGDIFPHVRDERVFDPALYDRATVRSRFGFEPDDRVVLFIGTPRLHKGVLEIAEALKRIGNPRYKLCVIGTSPDRPVREQLSAVAGEQVRLFPDQPFRDLPESLVMGDLICLLQDPDDEIAKYQMPAKFTDALSMGVPLIGRETPPLRAAAAAGLIELVGERPLHEKIAESFADHEASRARAVANRERFLAEYSYTALAPRMERVIRGLVERTPPPSDELERLLALQRRLFSPVPSVAPAARPPAGKTNGAGSPAMAWTTSNGRAPSNGKRPSSPVRGPSDVRTRRVTARRAEIARGEPFDLVFFWKQNDSDLYGRRQDMMVKYLAKSEQVRRIVHFDQAIDVQRLRSLRQVGDAAKVNESNAILRQTLTRVARPQVLGKVRRHTFVYRPEELAGTLRAARLLPRLEQYPAYVAGTLAAAGVGTRPTVFWVCPRNFEFPRIAELFTPDLVVADVIDDHRAWVDPRSPYHGKLAENYREVLGLSDIVLANNPSVCESMGEFADEVELVPNACEPPDEGPRVVRRPRELRRMRGPVIGYVGNLSSRIDIDLLEHVARARPAWNLVLIGSAHLSRDVLRLDRHANVHFLGVKTYPGVLAYVRHFDVGMIPHLDDTLTRSMNPLKLFVYCSARVPVVSTDIENVAELRSLVRIAGSAPRFVDEIEAALREGRREFTPEEEALLYDNSWPARVEKVISLLAKDSRLDRAPSPAISPRSA